MYYADLKGTMGHSTEKPYMSFSATNHSPPFRFRTVLLLLVSALMGPGALLLVAAVYKLAGKNDRAKVFAVVGVIILLAWLIIFALFNL